MKKDRRNRGISMIEMMIAGAIATIGILSVSGVLSDSQHGYNTMYGRIYSDVYASGHTAKRTFDTIVRKSSIEGFQIDPQGRWVEVRYYQDDASTALDSYARFIYQDNTLYAEQGRVNPRETTSINTICTNVTNCIFKRSGRTIHMMMTLNSGTQTLTVGTSAETHN
jgi:hypothetical protein